MTERVWSQYQKAIFEDVVSGQGHTIVDAKAGAGKTTVLLESFNYIPKINGSWPSVGFYAFNRDIADTLAQRAPKGCSVSTMHSYGLKSIGHAYGRAITVDPDRNMRLAREIIPANSENDREVRSSLCKAASMVKANLTDHNDLAALDVLVDRYEIDTCPESLLREEYLGKLRSLVGLMLDPLRDKTVAQEDMVWIPVKHNLPVWKHDRLLLDEVQDFTPCQTRLMRGAIKRGGRVLAVGDPNQAIYGWAGANVNAFAELQEALKAKRLPLSITYRCPQAVVRVAQEIVPELEAAPDAIEGVVRDTYYPELEKEAGPGDFILSRTNAPLVGLCLRFIREGKRAYISGRDVGGALISFVKKSGAFTVDALRRFAGQWKDAEIKRLADRDRDGNALQAVSDRYLTMMAVSEGAATVEDVVQRLRTLFEKGDAHSNWNRIMLSTTHRAKGLEADRVWMLADTYRNRPGVEESNLYYVAVTRAKRELIMVHGADLEHDEC